MEKCPELSRLSAGPPSGDRGEARSEGRRQGSLTERSHCQQMLIEALESHGIPVNFVSNESGELVAWRHREKLDDEVMRLRAARLALAALVACDKEEVALDPPADGAWGTLLHCVPGSVLAAPGSWQGNFR